MNSKEEHEREAAFEREQEMRTDWHQKQLKIKQEVIEREQKEIDDKNNRNKSVIIIKLIEALKISAITDENGEVLMPWTDELINEIIHSVET